MGVELGAGSSLRRLPQDLSGTDKDPMSETEDKPKGAEAGGSELSPSSSSIPEKVDTGKRFGAMFIDGLIAAGLTGVVSTVGNILSFIPFSGAIFGLAGGLLGGGYMLLRDSLNDGRSYGKKVMKLTVRTQDGKPCSQELSIQRNGFVALPYLVVAITALLGSIPFLGAIFALLLFPVLMLSTFPALYEGFQVLQLDPDGRRMLESKTQTYTIEE